MRTYHNLGLHQKDKVVYVYKYCAPLKELYIQCSASTIPCRVIANNLSHINTP